MDITLETILISLKLHNFIDLVYALSDIETLFVDLEFVVFKFRDVKCILDYVL